MKKKLKKIAGWILFGLIALTIIVSFEGRAQSVPFKVYSGVASNYARIYRSTINDRVVWTTLSDGKFYSDVSSADLSIDRVIPFDDTINFWIISKEKTLSVQYISPLNRNYYPVIILDGVDTRSGIRVPRKYWAYEEIVPDIISYYDTEYEY